MKELRINATLLLIFTYCSLLAQQQVFDTIIKKDGTTIQGKILKVNEGNIEIDPKGQIPFLILNRSEVESLIYSDGTLVKLETTANKEGNQSNNQNIVRGFYDKNGNRLNNIRLYLEPEFEIHPFRITSAGKHPVAEYRNIYFKDNVTTEKLWIMCKMEYATKPYAKGLDIGIVAIGASSVKISSHFILGIWRLDENDKLMDGYFNPISSNIQKFDENNWLIGDILDDINIIVGNKGEDYVKDLPSITYKDIRIDAKMRIIDWYTLPQSAINIGTTETVKYTFKEVIELTFNY
jgi:hypothetical protein